MVEDSRIKGKILGSINSTFLVLIPKQHQPLAFSDFRPISLCNLIYKIISKVISNRIKPILLRCISAEQLGFIKGRRIQDAIATAHECIHSIKHKNLKALVLKLDIQKAFDNVDWEFLRLILFSVGFGEQFSQWILSCVTNANIGVLINGEPSSFFKSERGLRQGCPLSPFLFILIMQGLSLLLAKRVEDQHLVGINFSNYFKLVHLLFCDDVLILLKAEQGEWYVIKETLQLFCLASGLSINYTKSTAHFWGISETELQQLKDIIPLPFINLSEGFTYLGYHLKLGSSSPCDWQWLVALYKNKIDFWCNKWLSIGGRYILIKSVLEGLAVYWMSLERIPAKVTSILRRLSINFLWNDQDSKRRFHLCNWQELSKPRKAGGWGLKLLTFFNSALLASSFWRALTANSIWSQLIKAKYLGSLPLYDWLRKPSLKQPWASSYWKGMVASSQVILHWIRWKPGNGTKILIGRDKILGLGDQSFLSPLLCARLEALGYSYLFQVKRPVAAPSLLDDWLDSAYLSLDGPLALEWSRYTSALKGAGITLTDQPDLLLWAGGDATGSLTVKNIYMPTCYR
jgi:hypothetical protein